jgi:hypothetical protein
VFHVEEAVDGVSVHVEEDRMRHRCIVPFLGQMVGVHAVRLKRPVGRVIARAAGRYRPNVALRAIDRDAHGLRVLVDIDRDFGASRRGKAGREHYAERGGTHVS